LDPAAKVCKNMSQKGYLLVQQLKVKLLGFVSPGSGSEVGCGRQTILILSKIDQVKNRSFGTVHSRSRVCEFSSC